MMKTVLLMFIVSLGCLMDQSKAQSCPDNWTEIKRKCYRVFALDMTCEDAESHCNGLRTNCDETEEGHLATVPCAWIQSELHELVGKETKTGDAFIGLMYGTTGTASWRDGSTTNYRSWAGSEPSIVGRGTCAAIRPKPANSKWVAHDSSTKGFHICMLPCVGSDII